MANRFLSQLENQPKAEKPPQTAGEPSPNRFLSQIEGMKFEPTETVGRSAARKAYQVGGGVLKRFTYPLDILKLAGQGEALAELNELDDARIEELKRLFPTAPWENFKGIDREKYLQAVQDAGDIFPTQENIERLIEEKTGAPLTPKTKSEKLIRLGGSASAFRPGDLAQKATAGVVAPAVTAGLEAAGVPEPLAEIGGLGASGVAPVPQFIKAVKPSGLTTRRFEGLKKPTTVSSGRQTAINEALEGDFKKIADQILEKNRTYSAMKKDNLFKEKVGNLFEKVESLAENIEGTIHTEDLRSAIKKRFNSRESKGISPDEFERSLRREVRKTLKDIPFEELSAPQLVEQFRKNNKSLRELFEPGKSSAFNRAKRESLLEYNRAIEDVIAKKYPDSEFKDLFEFTNKRWQEISDIEQIDNFVKNLFDEKVDYSKAKQLFRKDKEHVQRPFKRILGDEGYEDFKKITEDLLSTEKSMAYIKKAKDAGFENLAKTASLYLISKKAGTAVTLTKSAKFLYQMLLDKPQTLVTWRNAFESLKHGKYKEAEKYFASLNKEITTKDQISNPKSQPPQSK